MSETAARYAATQSEKAFMQEVIAYARLCGWLVFHPFDSRHSEAGYPDLTLVRERVVFAETKTERGQLSAAQGTWRDRLIAAEAEWYLWRPSDWPRIARTLARQEA